MSQPEIRKDPIVGRWVVFSPERLRRPQDFAVHHQVPPDPAGDPFMEGHESFTPPEVWAERGNTPPNGPGWRVRVVPNRYPALRVEGELDKEAVGFYDRMSGIGAHEVVVETPEVDKELEDLDLADLVHVVRAWRARMLDLMRDKRFRYIMVFKNVGLQAGASLRHAHSQIIALPVTPMVVKNKLLAAREYFREKDRNLFADILRNEINDGERMVLENDGFAAFCPFASRFPFEVCLMPRTQSADFHAARDHELVLFADALQRLLRAYRRGLERPSYNLILHTAPVRRARTGHWDTLDFDFRWHVELLPRLSGVAGFEFGTGFFINPVLPEEAARFLRGVHHGNGGGT